ncbi:hypothetical protein ZWY2020_003414 [Hordeum vulgare]|nr:hypothetical protein ZWY2020_010319 [Hordeum vulgare]KAI4972489.1 hypothetical protein ZWY2020_003414 [Hordeum vulgare]
MAGAAIRFVQDTIVFVVMILVTVYDLHILTVCEDENVNTKYIWTIIWVGGNYTSMMMMMFRLMMMMMMMDVFSFN